MFVTEGYLFNHNYYFVCHGRLRGGSIHSDVVVNMVHYYCKNDENEAMMASMETLENDASLSQKISRRG